MAFIGLSSMSLNLAPAEHKLLHRVIPSTGEEIPSIGLGSWITFDVRGDAQREHQMGKVLTRFANLGGKVVDSSPMYGSSEYIIGSLASKNHHTNDLWFATKVWTQGAANGRRQIERSANFFHNRIQLHQIHNLRDFETHYPYLQQLKEEGHIRYVGVTHYLNSAHNELVELLQRHRLDFLQINYNIENPNAEHRLLPVAADQGVAVIVNRPFQTGRIFRLVGKSKVPEWVKDRGIKSWATYFLKYILSNPHVTCTIPATTQVPHVEENLLSSTGWIPSWKEHLRLAKDFNQLI